MGIHSEIEDLKRQKREYERDISELEEIYSLVRNKQAKLRTECYEPSRAYDISVSGEFIGRREEDAVEYKNMLYSRTSTKMDEIERFLSNINVTIENIRELIRECDRQIEHLEAQLCSSQEY